jgi:hypothetical protein
MKPIVRALLAFVVSLVRSPVSLCVTLRLGLPRPELRMDDGERHTHSAAAGGAGISRPGVRAEVKSRIMRGIRPVVAAALAFNIQGMVLVAKGRRQ